MLLGQSQRASMRHKIPELVLVVDVAAGGDEMATSEVLVKVGIVSSIKLVDRHLPDWMAA